MYLYLTLGRRFAGQVFCFFGNGFAAYISILHLESFEEDFSRMVLGLLVQCYSFIGNFPKDVFFVGLLFISSALSSTPERILPS